MSSFSIDPRVRIRITNLRLRTIIGHNEWERHKKQEVVANIDIVIDAADAVAGDCLKDTLDYRQIKQAIMKLAEENSFVLLEKFTHEILNTIMKDRRIITATVRVDKPHALRFSDSVSVKMSAERKK